MRPNWSTCAAACAAESSNAGAADGARTAVAKRDICAYAKSSRDTWNASLNASKMANSMAQCGGEEHARREARVQASKALLVDDPSERREHASVLALLRGLHPRKGRVQGLRRNSTTSTGDGARNYRNK